MTTREWNEGMNRIDSALVEEYLAQKERLKEQKRRKKRWLMWSTSAAVLCLIAILSVVFRGFFPISITPPDGNGSTHTPPESAAGTIDATVFPEKLTGSEARQRSRPAGKAARRPHSNSVPLALW